MRAETTPLKSAASGRRSGLSRKDGKTLSLTAVGGALEYYDFIVVVFFTAILAKVFFPPEIPQWLAQFQIFVIFAVGYLVRPVGGALIAHFGDKIGRKKMFAVSLFLMAAPTLLIGLLPSYHSVGLLAPVLFLLCRILQGLSIGGEAPGAFIFCSEHVTKSRIGLACGLIMSGFCVGILLGALTAKLLTTYMAADALNSWGWRVPFIMGGIFGLVVVYLRRYLHETPVFVELREKKELATKLPLSIVLSSHKRWVLWSMACTWAFSGIFVIYYLYFPTYLQTQWKFAAADVFTANCWAIFALIIGGTFAGWLADLVGAGRAFAVGSVATLVLLIILGQALTSGSDSVLTLYIVGGFIVGIITIVPYIIVRSFTPEIRFTGFALSYNTAYAIFGGTAPAMLAILIGQAGHVLAPFYYMAALCVMAIIIGLYWRPVDEADQGSSVDWNGLNESGQKSAV